MGWCYHQERGEARWQGPARKGANLAVEDLLDAEAERATRRCVELHPGLDARWDIELGDRAVQSPDGGKLGHIDSRLRGCFDGPLGAQVLMKPTLSLAPWVTSGRP